MIRLAVIGLGGRSHSLVHALKEATDDITVTSVIDPNREGAEKYLKQLEIDSADVAFYEDTDAWLTAGSDDNAIILGTRCNIHAPLAVKVAATGLPMLLEKPIAIDATQLESLIDAYKGRDNVVISFPLRYTPLFQAALDILDSGRLGEINQLQAINNVPYGGVYYSKPYRDPEITHGLWLQKATHDFDYINLMIASRPETVAATSTQKIYGGERDFDLMCSQCEDAEICLESPKNLRRRNSANGMPHDDHSCVYAKGIENQDAGSALIEYECRTNVTYTQNFATRRGAGKRGAIITGSDATLEFDWYTSKIKVWEHAENRVDDIEVNATTGHMGGDSQMMENFLEVIKGNEESYAPLSAGYLSVAMCLAADASCKSRKFEQIPLLDTILPE